MWVESRWSDKGKHHWRSGWLWYEMIWWIYAEAWDVFVKRLMPSRCRLCGVKSKSCCCLKKHYQCRCQRCVYVCDICGKMYIFEGIVGVPLWNVHCEHCELNNVEFVVHFVPDGDVRFEVGHNFISCPSMSPNTVYFVVLPCTVDWSHWHSSLSPPAIFFLLNHIWNEGIVFLHTLIMW